MYFLAIYTSEFTSKEKVSSKEGLLVFFFTFVFFWSDLKMHKTKVIHFRPLLISYHYYH